MAGFNRGFFSRRSRLPVFCCRLLLITSNNSKLVLCQTTQSHSNTPWPLSSSCLVSPSPSLSPPLLLQCGQKPNRRPRCPAIDLRVVMTPERLPAPGSDLGARAGLRKAWIAIDFHLIQSFHLDSNLLPVHCGPIGRPDLSLQPLPPAPFRGA